MSKSVSPKRRAREAVWSVVWSVEMLSDEHRLRGGPVGVQGRHNVFRMLDGRSSLLRVEETHIRTMPPMRKRLCRANLATTTSRHKSGKQECREGRQRAWIERKRIVECSHSDSNSHAYSRSNSAHCGANQRKTKLCGTEWSGKLRRDASLGKASNVLIWSEQTRSRSDPDITHLDWVVISLINQAVTGLQSTQKGVSGVVELRRAYHV